MNRLPFPYSSRSRDRSGVWSELMFLVLLLAASVEIGASFYAGARAFAPDPTDAAMPRSVILGTNAPAMSKGPIKAIFHSDANHS